MAGELVGRLTDELVDWLAGQLVTWLTAHLVAWLTVQLVNRLTGELVAWWHVGWVRWWAGGMEAGGMVAWWHGGWWHERMKSGPPAGSRQEPPAVPGAARSCQERHSGPPDLKHPNSSHAWYPGGNLDPQI